MRTLLLWVTFCVTSFGANASLLEMNMKLKSADKYIMATGGYSSLIIGSDANINGDIASQYYIGLSSSTYVKGNACARYVGMGANSDVSGKVGRCSGLRNLQKDIYRANKKAASFKSENLGSIYNDKVINVTGNEAYKINNLTLQADETLTINGTSDSAAIINIYGDALLGSGSNIILSGGITSANVLFNFVGLYTSLNIGAANISGTYLANNTSFVIGDGATLDDTRFLSNDSIIANIQSISYGRPISEIGNIGDIDGVDHNSSVDVPETEMIILFLAGAFFITGRKRLKND